MRKVIEKYQSLPFVWGTSDCCTFVAECIEERTGSNPMAHLQYSSEEEANALIHKHSGLHGMIQSLLGKPRMLDEKPQHGDCVLTMGGGQFMAGIVYRDRVVVRTKKGVTDWPLHFALRAWPT